MFGVLPSGRLGHWTQRRVNAELQTEALVDRRHFAINYVIIRIKRSRLLHKLQSHPIHAVTQSRWLRPVIEHMTEMSFALRAQDFSARHARALVGFFDDIFFFDWRPETWPAGSRIELLF